MSDILADKLAWLWSQQKRHRGITVTYHRGLASIAVTAVMGKTTAEQADQYGIVQKVTCVDFIVEAVDLIVDDTQITPKSGDQIKRTAGYKILVYEVMSPGDRPAVEPSNTPEVLRIHTKLVDTETE